MCARVFSPVRLDPMSHIVPSPVCLDQLSPITLCYRFCGSGIAGVTSQVFDTLKAVNLVLYILLYLCFGIQLLGN